MSGITGETFTKKLFEPLVGYNALCSYQHSTLVFIRSVQIINCLLVKLPTVRCIGPGPKLWVLDPDQTLFRARVHSPKPGRQAV